MVISDNIEIMQAGTVLNSYHGGAYQQTTSGLATTNQVRLPYLAPGPALTVVCRIVIPKVAGASLSMGLSTGPALTVISLGSMTMSLLGRFAALEWVLILAWILVRDPFLWSRW